MGAKSIYKLLGDTGGDYSLHKTSRHRSVCKICIFRIDHSLALFLTGSGGFEEGIYEAFSTISDTKGSILPGQLGRSIRGYLFHLSHLLLFQHLQAGSNISFKFSHDPGYLDIRFVEAEEWTFKLAFRNILSYLSIKIISHQFYIMADIGHNFG